MKKYSATTEDKVSLGLTELLNSHSLEAGPDTISFYVQKWLILLLSGFCNVEKEYGMILRYDWILIVFWMSLPKSAE